MAAERLPGWRPADVTRLLNFGVRLAVVCPPGTVRFSSRFEGLMTNPRMHADFGVFDTREAARAWLARTGPAVAP